MQILETPCIVGRYVMKIMRKWCILIAALLILAGCGGPPSHVTDPGEPSLPQGYTAAADAESGCSLAYPSGWQPGQFPTMSLGALDSANPDSAGGDPSAADAMAKLDESLKKSAQASSGREKEALRKEGIVLIFNDGSRPIPGEENTRLYLQVKEDVHGLEDAAGEFSKSMVLATKTPVQTPIGKSIRLNSDYTNKGGDRIHEIGYVWAEGDKAYALRLICTGEKQPIASVAEPVMQTVRIRPPKK